MSSKYLVVEVHDGNSLEELMEKLEIYSAGMKVVDEVPGIFSSEATNEAASLPLSLNKSSRKRMRGEPKEDCKPSPRSIKRISTESILSCGLCDSKLTMRACYGRTRLREHVVRHLNLCTAACRHCDFKGILRDTVRRHILKKHNGEPKDIDNLEPGPDYNERFEQMWKICFPTTEMPPSRKTSQKGKALESIFFEAMEAGNINFAQKMPAANFLKSPTVLSDDTFYEPMEPPY